MFYTYVLRSLKDKQLYTGSTNNLRDRFKRHQSEKVLSTSKRGPFELIYYECSLNEIDCRKRERFLKSGPGKKYLKNRLKYSLKE